MTPLTTMFCTTPPALSTSHSSTTGLQVSSVVITGLNEMAGINTGLNIYPNPNNGAFIIKGGSANRLSITNQPGQLITNSQLNESNHYKGRVSGLAPGIYYVVSQGSDAVATWKIVVTK